MDTARLSEFATRYTEAWCSQDPARVASFFAADGSLTINEGSPCVGPAAITAAARGFMSAFPDMAVRMDRLEVVGDGARYYWTLTGTHTGPGGTGNAVRISGHEEWRIGPDGLIVESRGHFDEADYARQLAAATVNPTPNPFAGMWIANLAKSRRHEKHQFQSATLRFAVSEDAIALTQEGVNMAGNHESSTLMLKADGQEHAVSPQAPGVVVITRWLGPRTLETMGKRGADTVGWGRYEVSPDGATLTASVRGTDAQGAAFDQVIVFDRASPHHS